MKLEEIIGTNVRGFRENLGLSQEKFALQAGLHRTFIGTVERAEQNLSIASIRKLADALKVDAYVLLIEGAYKNAKKVQRIYKETTSK